MSLIKPNIEVLVVNLRKERGILVRDPHVSSIKEGYDPKRIEEEVLDWWRKNRIYEKVKGLREGMKKFYFLDGPPYVTNPPHVGTAWNKTLKDCIIRFRRMQGYDVNDQPGYDCHGLPIEVKVEESLGLVSKKDIEEWIGVEKFIEKCKEFVRKYEAIQTECFERLGVWMDWRRPYLTYLNDYIESAWWTLKKAKDKGLLEVGFKVVHWCPRCETALAGYEITDEYRIVRDPSIYVKFPVLGKEREYILIWTTTPWTLPANVAVMVHPREDYVRVLASEEIFILARARCESVFSELGIDYEVLEAFKGEGLENLSYRHPLLEEVPIQSSLKGAHKVVLSEEYVNVEEGTGCVHMATGHGEEDYEVGLRYGLPILSLVGPLGRFTEEGGKYAEKDLKEANRLVIEDLHRKGLLLFEGTVDHEYPHCWRCKTPLILRATEQWFVKVREFKDKMLKENEKVLWVPEWAGSKRFKDWISKARDWVISRQRYWGVPLPIWICDDCKNWEVIGSIDELKEKAISIPEEIELHRPWVDEVLLKCSCGGIARRIPDVLDVWMDSGIAAWASLGYPRLKERFKRLWPVDLVIEAHDQTRGWFYSLLGAGMIVFDRCPYTNVLMHGHALDRSGRKLSKSLGTFISPEEVVERCGADALRFYGLQCTVWEDFRFKMEDVDSVLKTLNIMWNVYKFAGTYMELDKFNPKETRIGDLLDQLSPEDRWILSRFHSLIKKATELLDRYHIHEVARLLDSFIKDDVSRWYVKLIRRRVWMEKEDVKKLTAYAVMYEVLKGFLLLMSPFTPFITEAINLQMFKPVEPDLPESIHACSWPKFNEELIDQDLEAKMEITREVSSAISRVRQQAKLKLRWPVKAIKIVLYNEEVVEALDCFHDMLKEQVNCEVLEVLSAKAEVEVPPHFVVGESVYGKIYLDPTRTPELLAMSLAKEVVRRTQLMRKEKNLDIDAYIDLVIVAEKEETVKLISSMSEYIMAEVRSKALQVSTAKEIGGIEAEFYVKGWEIEEEIVKIGIL